MRFSRFIRSPAARLVIGQAFAHMSFAVPVHRLRETAALMAFHHPQPSYPIHILLVPKKAIANLAALTPADSDFMVDLFATVQSLVAEFGLEKSGYRLIANGGPYQAVPQLHFHLISDSATQSSKGPRMPIEIRLVQTQLDAAIVAYDGRILEIFHTLWEGKTRRYHAALIADIQVQTDKKGAHTLNIKSKQGYTETLTVEGSALPSRSWSRRCSRPWGTTARNLPAELILLRRFT